MINLLTGRIIVICDMCELFSNGVDRVGVQSISESSSSSSNLRDLHLRPRTSSRQILDTQQNGQVKEHERQAYRQRAAA